MTSVKLADTFLDRIKANRSSARTGISDKVAAVQRVYVKTQNDKLLDEELTRFFDSIVRELDWQSEDGNQASAMRGGRVLMVTGGAGAGKTRAISELFRSRPELEGFGEIGMGCPLLSVVAPSPFTLKALGNEIVRKLGYHSRREIRQSEVWPMIKLLFAEHGIRILHIDEAQHGDQVNSSVAQEIEDTLKGLLQDVDWTIWLMLSGLPELARFCQADQSVLRRISHIRFQSVTFPAHAPGMREVIRKLMDACPDVEFEKTLTDEFMHRLIHAAGGQFGILIEFIHEALEACLKAGERVLQDTHFADAWVTKSGDERDEANVFIADRFDDIDVASVLWEEPVSTSIAPSRAAIRRARQKTRGKNS